jgi:hypothetical protein
MMADQHNAEQKGKSPRPINWVLIFLAGILVLVLVMGVNFIRVNYFPPSEPNSVSETERAVEPRDASNLIVEGKDKQSGLIAQGDYLLVKNTCTACHSSKLILQAQFSEQTWIEKIRWMQAKQKLWDLGSNEKPILAYLTKYYGPDSIQVAFRKPPLKDIKWYKLND